MKTGIWVMMMVIVGSVAANALVVIDRDPFLPKYTVKKAVGSISPTAAASNAIQLKGIIWDSQTPIAILELNGVSQSASAGEMVFGGTVVRIEPRRVLLNRHGKNSILNLGTSSSL